MRRSAEENPDDCPVEGHLAKVARWVPCQGYGAMGVCVVWSSDHEWDSTYIFFRGMWTMSRIPSECLDDHPPARENNRRFDH